MKKKVCKKCKIFAEGNECDICKGNQFTTSWQGRVNILDINKSIIAKKISVTVNGDYALKSR
ncbi:MAG: transcription elongation factor subunit Spt4 [Nanoarchaeota archaeon]